MALILILSLVLIGTAAFAATYEGYTQEEFDALEETTVIPSEDSPTGYYVTFRFPDDDYNRVRIFGEWWFSDVENASLTTSLFALPDEWQDGYIEWGAESWPTADMALNEETGVWAYTIPLPNGIWNYRFYIGGADDAELDDYTDAVMASDPNNVPYVYDFDAELSREEYLSSIYVPLDPNKQAGTQEITGAIAEQMPREGENGDVSFRDVTLEDGRVVAFGVYLPYGYDESREEEYPVFVLFHGGGGAAGSWFNNGLVNILDNMIAEGRLEPTIVITPNGSAFPDPEENWDRPLLLDAVVNTILPYVSENYNASEDPARRAFGGLSQGGATVMHAYFNNTEDFQYFIALSPPMKGNVYPDYGKEELKNVTLYMGVGQADKLGCNGDAYIYDLEDAGIDFVFENDLDYGHQWALWRILITRVFDNVLWQ